MSQTNFMSSLATRKEAEQIFKDKFFTRIDFLTNKIRHKRVQVRTAVYKEMGKSLDNKILDKMDEIKAYNTTLKNFFSIELTRQAVIYVEKENATLNQALENIGSNPQIVRPWQAFTNGLCSDELTGRLDLSRKIGFLQNFITKLRNRCTQVDSRTSGPSLVFSVKDLQDCIEQLCRQMVRFGEVE